MRQSLIIKLDNSEASWLNCINDLAVNKLFAEEADCNQIEEFVEIMQTNPKSAVVFISQIDLSTCFSCPKRRFIRPGTVPLFLAPWVANFQQFFFFPIVLSDLFHSNQRIGMSINNTGIFKSLLVNFRLVLAACSTTHCEIVFVCPQKMIIENVFVLVIF